MNPNASFLDGLTSKGEPGILNRNAKKCSPPLQADVLMAFNHRQEALQQAAAASSNAGRDVVSMPGHELQAVLQSVYAMQSANLAPKTICGCRASGFSFRVRANFGTGGRGNARGAGGKSKAKSLAGASTKSTLISEVFKSDEDKHNKWGV